MRSLVGIKDIAKAAGVSISTVSYALNGSQKVTEKTRARIVAIADELNYVPNMAARTLKRQQTKIIGVYLADYGGSFYGELLEGVKRGLEAFDYEMIVCSGKKSHLFIPERMIDGSIILDWSFQTKEIIKYADLGYSLVVLDREIDHTNIKKVLLDNTGGATLAIEKIIADKAERVYLVTGAVGYDTEKRLEASTRELDRYGINYELVEGAFTETSGYQAAKEIMAKKPTYPIHIFSFNDEMAVGIYKYIAETEAVIGKDVKLIGFDNIDLGRFLQPSLATIAYSKHRWGMIAAEKIVQLINEEATEDEQIYTTYVPGDSFP